MRSSFFTLKAYSVALLTLAAGAGLSLHLSDWGWLSRSGSLVVINGIILTSHQIIEHIHQLGRWQAGDSPCSRDWARADRRHFVHADHQVRWVSEKHGLFMLVFGTLVWGFGDLPELF